MSECRTAGPGTGTVQTGGAESGGTTKRPRCHTGQIEAESERVAEPSRSAMWRPAKPKARPVAKAVAKPAPGRTC